MLKGSVQQRLGYPVKLGITATVEDEGIAGQTPQRADQSTDLLAGASVWSERCDVLLSWLAGNPHRADKLDISSVAATSEHSPSRHAWEPLSKIPI